MKYKLIKLLQETFEQQYEKRNLLTAMHTAEYLLENGVIVPPCKIGDKVYYITGIHRNLIKSAIVNEIIINCNGVSDLFVSSDTADFENSIDIFYFTREEAENALKERLSE